MRLHLLVAGVLLLGCGEKTETSQEPISSSGGGSSTGGATMVEDVATASGGAEATKPGTPSPPEDDPPLDLEKCAADANSDNFLDCIALAFCARLDQCCGDQGEPHSRDKCVERMAEQFEGEALTDGEWGTYNPEAGSDCLKSIMAESCFPLPKFYGPSCARAFGGLTPPGEPCVKGFECASTSEEEMFCNQEEGVCESLEVFTGEDLCLDDPGAFNCAIQANPGPSCSDQEDCSEGRCAGGTCTNTLGWACRLYSQEIGWQE